MMEATTVANLNFATGGISGRASKCGDMLGVCGITADMTDSNRRILSKIASHGSDAVRITAIKNWQPTRKLRLERLKERGNLPPEVMWSGV